MTRMTRCAIAFAIGCAGLGSLGGCEIGEDGPADEEEIGVETQEATGPLFTFTPTPTSKFVPPHIGGDRDFSGHGPFVVMDATLEVRNQREVWARVHFDAEETRSDWTHAAGTTELLLRTHSVPVRIASSTLSDDFYTDTNHDDDVRPQGGTELVNQFICTGDTRGDESGTRTGVRLFFNPITLEEIRDTCVGQCGGQSGACWCDAACVHFGDCCFDACSVCGQC